VPLVSFTARNPILIICPTLGTLKMVEGLTRMGRQHSMLEKVGKEKLISRSQDKIIHEWLLSG